MSCKFAVCEAIKDSILKSKAFELDYIKSSINLQKYVFLHYRVADVRFQKHSGFPEAQTLEQCFPILFL